MTNKQISSMTDELVADLKHVLKELDDKEYIQQQETEITDALRAKFGESPLPLSIWKR